MDSKERLYKQVLDFSKSWYRSVPPVRAKPFDLNFLEFVIESDRILAYVLESRPVIKLAKETTAFTDLQDIYLPRIMLTKSFYDEMFGFEVDYHDLHRLCSVISTAFVLHEGSHILHTKKIPPWFFEKKGRSDVLNIVEDIFIDNACFEDFPAQAEFLKLSLDVLIGIRAKPVVDEFAKGRPIENVNHILNLMTSYKVPSLRAQVKKVEKLKDIVPLLEKLTDSTLGWKNRTSIAKAICEIIESMVESEEIGESEEKGDVIGVDEKFKGDGSSPSKPFDTDENFDSFATKDIARKLEYDPDFKKEMGELVEEILKLEKEASERKSLLDSEKLSDDGSVEISSMDRVGSVLSPYPPDPKFSNFSNYIKSISAPKRNTSPLMKTGTKIKKRSIHNIAIDGKIMHSPAKDSKDRAKPNIVMLLDMSGSTGGGLNVDILSAAYAAFRSLRDASINISVWGHSGSSSCRVYPIAFHNMPKPREALSGSAEQLFGKARRIPLQENYDGYALLAVSEYVPVSGKTVIFHLSDGQPAGRGYHGRMAITHTKGVISGIRKKGLGVVSISLVEHVVRYNDDIYGKDQNVDASRSLATSLMEAIEKSLY